MQTILYEAESANTGPSNYELEVELVQHNLTPPCIHSHNAPPVSLNTLHISRLIHAHPHSRCIAGHIVQRL